MTHPSSGLVIIVCGPAGSGKTTLCERMCQEMYPQVQRIITTTSRDPRPGEKEGVDYYFVSKETFQEKVRTNQFYEHALVHKRCYYGCEKQEVQQKLSQNIDILLNIDIQGAETFRQAAKTDPILKGKLVTIFILPPSLDELKRRLEDRDPNATEETARRIETAKEEIPHHNRFDYCIVSSTKEEDFKQLTSIYNTAKRKIPHGTSTNQNQ